MITFSRRQALLFRAVLKNSLLDQEPQREWPLIVCQTGPTGLTLSAQKGDVAVQYHVPGELGEEVMAFRSTLLAELEARSDEPVTLEQLAPDKGKASWKDGEVPRSLDIDLVTPDSVPSLPPIPGKFLPYPNTLRQALGEATLFTAKQNVRFTLMAVQVRGKKGEIVATNGKQLLLQGGFEFPWHDDFLIPALPVFLRRNLLPNEPLSMGRSKSHLGLRIGNWTFLLKIDDKSRFPSTQGVIPDPRGVTCKLIMSPKDAELLLRALPKMPSSDQDTFPVTLDLEERVLVRTKGPDEGQITEIELPNSRIEGCPTRLNLNRQHLHRALQLGFLQLEVIKPEQPVMCRDKDRVCLWLPLDPKGALPSVMEAPRISPVQDPIPVIPESERREVMALPNNHVPLEPEQLNGHPSAPPVTLEALVTEAEQLRSLVHEAGARLARLTGALKQFRRQNRVFDQAVTSLRQISLKR